MRGRLAGKYIFFELLPSYLLGLFIFVVIVLMFQAFRLTEYVLVHGASAITIIQIMFFLSLSFIPILFPMALLFCVLLIYGRLSNDSEIVAFKSLGLHTTHLIVPPLLLAVFTFVVSAYTSFYLAPWGNRKMEVLIHHLGESKPEAALKEGIFAEGFFDLVVYTNQIDSKAGELRQVFIYDERDKKSPLTIISESGKILQEKSDRGETAFLRLQNGDIHTSTKETYTKIHFETYDINLFNPYELTDKTKTNLSYNADDLVTALKDPKLDAETRTSLQIEWHRRWALSAVCVIFALLGVGMGTKTDRRAGRGSGFALCVLLIAVYWVIYAGSDNMARSGALPVVIAMWIPNLVFGSLTTWALRRIW